ncbi:tail fiber assembly protein, partial [Salmonella enterica]|uniref:tail fiber assembly protein n=1 Tax=Salmonella enterica TaxID=28901 RepID=UPI001F2192BE
RIYTPEELRQQAEVKKAKLLEEAENVITPLARAVKRNIATDDSSSGSQMRLSLRSNFAQPTEQVCRLCKVCVANARLSL